MSAQHNFSCKVAYFNGFVLCNVFRGNNPLDFKINSACFPKRLFEDFLRAGKVRHDDGCFALFCNSERAVAEFLELSGLCNPALGVNPYGADAVLQKLSGLVYSFKGFAVVLPVECKAGSFVKKFFSDGIGEIFLAAYKSNMKPPEKHYRDGRIHPRNVIAYQKKARILWEKFLSLEIYTHPQNLEEKVGRFSENTIKKSVLLVDGFVEINKERQKSAHHNMPYDAQVKNQKRHKRCHPRPVPVESYAPCDAGRKGNEKADSKKKIVKHCFPRKQ